MNTENDNDENNVRLLLQQKANTFLILGVRVHISYKNGIWKRGIVKEVSTDFFILEETLEGELPVFYLEITDIEKYMIKKEVIKDGTRSD